MPTLKVSLDSHHLKIVSIFRILPSISSAHHCLCTFSNYELFTYILHIYLVSHYTHLQLYLPEMLFFLFTMLMPMGPSGLRPPIILQHESIGPQIEDPSASLLQSYLSLGSTPSLNQFNHWFIFSKMAIQLPSPFSKCTG